MRIDLHTHSACSDGTQTPTELMVAASSAGLDVVGLTDHDTISGWDEAAAAVSVTGVQLVRGIELTTRDDNMSVHLLGYLFDPEAEKLRKHRQNLKNSRYERVAKMVELIGKDYPITIEQIEERVGVGVPLGRPHIADELIRIGVIKTREEGFMGILRPGSPYYVRNYSPSTLDAISWVNEAGGKAVLAHPLGIKRGGAIKFSRFMEFKEAGLFGVEVAHRDNDRALLPELENLITRLDLARFGASDYHGSGKPNLLGENTTSEEVLALLCEGSFLEVIRP
ncbi:MAG: PHP domain-containing protein [Arcanobacterium sp.]|nr:PHP domain-containing protein [Arcanobacterium sp.]